MNESMENEITAVKVRHLGQCPQEKGHSGNFGIGFFLGAMAAYFLGLAMWALVLPDYRGEAIQRGYAIHDPKTGKFSWR